MSEKKLHFPSSLKKRHQFAEHKKKQQTVSVVEKWKQQQISLLNKNKHYF